MTNLEKKLLAWVLSDSTDFMNLVRRAVSLADQASHQTGFSNLTIRLEEENASRRGLPIKP